MGDPKDLAGLFVRKLRHVYDTEQRLTKALPKMLAIPTAREGAPPVRANKLASPMAWARAFICS